MLKGYISVNQERYGALELTEASRAILKGELQLFLREDMLSAKPLRAKSGQKAKRKSYGNVSEADHALWDALKDKRKQLADEQGVPPYHIFHDATLMEMMEHRPQDSAELLTMNGVGEVKLERYGEAFLDVLCQYPTQ